MPRTLSPWSGPGAVNNPSGSTGGGSGAVDSVNGQTGNVVLTPATLGAADASHTHDHTEITDFDTEVQALIDASAPEAEDVAVTPSGNLAATDVQAALAELQSDIDTLTALGGFLKPSGDAAAGGNFPASTKAGEAFRASSAGDFGTTNKITVQVGDWVYAKTDDASATDGDDWGLIDAVQVASDVAVATISGLSASNVQAALAELASTADESTTGRMTAAAYIAASTYDLDGDVDFTTAEPAHAPGAIYRATTATGAGSTTTAVTFTEGRLYVSDGSDWTEIEPRDGTRVELAGKVETHVNGVWLEAGTGLPDPTADQIALGYILGADLTWQAPAHWRATSTEDLPLAAAPAIGTIHVAGDSSAIGTVGELYAYNGGDHTVIAGYTLVAPQPGDSRYDEDASARYFRNATRWVNVPAGRAFASIVTQGPDFPAKTFDFATLSYTSIDIEANEEVAVASETGPLMLGDNSGNLALIAFDGDVLIRGPQGLSATNPEWWVLHRVGRDPFIDGVVDVDTFGSLPDPTTLTHGDFRRAVDTGQIYKRGPDPGAWIAFEMTRLPPGARIRIDGSTSIDTWSGTEWIPGATSGLFDQLTRWDSTLGAGHAVEQVFVGDAPAVRLSGTDAGDFAFYSVQAQLPTDAAQYTRIEIARQAAGPTNLLLLRVGDTVNGFADLTIDPTDGTTTTAQSGTYVAPTVVGASVREHKIEVVALWPQQADAEGWSIVPDHGAAVTETGFVDILALDLDYDYVAPSALTTIRVDASAAAFGETLPASTGSNAERLYILNDVSNGAILTPASGDSIGGAASDATHNIAAYGAGSKVLLTDDAAGQWGVSVIGAPGVAPRNTITAALTSITLRPSQTGTTILYGQGSAASEEISIESVTYYDEGSVRTVIIDAFERDDDSIGLRLDATLVPAGAYVESVTGMWRNTDSDTAPNEGNPFTVIVDETSGTTNGVNINRLNGINESNAIRLVVKVAGAAQGQTVLAGNLPVETVQHGYYHFEGAIPDVETTDANDDFEDFDLTSAIDFAPLAVAVANERDPFGYRVGNTITLPAGTWDLVYHCEHPPDAEGEIGGSSTQENRGQFYGKLRIGGGTATIRGNSADSASTGEVPVQSTLSRRVTFAAPTTVELGFSADGNLGFPNLEDFVISFSATEFVPPVDRTVLPAATEVDDQPSSEYRIIGDTQECWGQAAATGAVVSFPVPFATPPRVLATEQTAGVSSDRIIQVGTVTTTGFTLHSWNTGANSASNAGEPANWLAIGTKA